MALVYVDTSEVREGKRQQLDEAIAELAKFIEANVPEVLAYNVFLSDDGSEMTVVHVHAEPASLDRHLETGGPVFRKFADLLTLKSIRLYGEPSEHALELLSAKASMLGSGDVEVLRPRAGFSRLEPVAKLD
jgi:Antibiotic biosynthesis monooxygenase